MLLLPDITIVITNVEERFSQIHCAEKYFVKFRLLTRQKYLLTFCRTCYCVYLSVVTRQTTQNNVITVDIKQQAMRHT